MGTIYRPVAATALTPLENVFGAVADSIEALPMVGTVADLAAVAAYTTGASFTSGDLLQIQEGGYFLQYLAGAWSQLTVAKFASVSAANTALAKASGVYKVAGFRIKTAVDLFERAWSTSTSTWKPYGAGLLPILPGASNGTIGPEGQVSWASGVTVNTLDNIFSADFDDYVAYFELVGPASGTVAAAKLQWRTSVPANDATALYKYGGFFYDPGTGLTHDVGASAQTSGDIGFTYRTVDTTNMSWTIDIKNPAKAVGSRYRSSLLTDGQELIRTGTLVNTATHAGLQLLQSLAVTGVARVFGVNNL